jgi:hypothetical protein
MISDDIPHISPILVTIICILKQPCNKEYKIEMETKAEIKKGTV